VNSDKLVRGGRRPAMLLAVVALVLFSGGLRAEDGDEVWWSITPYVWAMDTQLDLSWRDSPIGGTEIDFKDALDQLDAAFQVAVEGGRGRWSAFADLTFVKISDAVGEDPLRLKSKNKQVFLDAAVSFWPGGVGTPLSVYGGMRYHGFDNVYRLQNQGSDIARRESSTDYVDALLGLRYRFDLSERWSIVTLGDVSFGESEGTWQAQALAAYTVGKRRMNRIMFGYRYRDAEFDDAELTTEYAFHGPLVGFSFRF
jgi:hypothetical protein